LKLLKFAVFFHFS